MLNVPKVSTDDNGKDALLRIAHARDTALKQSNRFLLFGLASSVFYAVKLAGLRIDIVIADTKIFETPYGLFIFGVVGAASFILAQLRYLDAEAFDRKIRKLAPLNGPEEFKHLTFPSMHHWLEPAAEEFGSENAPAGAKFAFGCLGVLTFLFYLTPLFAAAHFLIEWPEFAGETYTDLQWWLVFVMLIGAILVYCIAQWLHFRRD